MYDSMTKQNFDRVSDDVDRVSGAVDNDFDKINTDKIQMPYDHDNNITTGNTKYERNMTDELKDTDIKDTVPHDRDDNTMTKVKWSTETNDIDNRFLREYDNMCKLMEDRQITDYYEAQRHIQSTMMGDTSPPSNQPHFFKIILSILYQQKYEITLELIFCCVNLYCTDMFQSNNAKLL